MVKCNFDPDKPIENASQDILGRKGYSKKLAEAILNYNCDDCLVIGLLGPWGHGKSSVIKMTIENILNLSEYHNQTDSSIISSQERSKANNGSSNNTQKPIIIEFNPWLYSNQNQLIKKFFDELTLAINDETITTKIKAYTKKLILPIVGIAGMIDPGRTQFLFRLAEFFQRNKSEEESLKDLKKELNELFLDLYKVIIVIDDIDRLTPLEIRQTFQLVKLVADFPNTIYILSFDKQAVIKALDDDNGMLGEEYIKKIIQIPFNVPEIYKHDIDNFLFNQLSQYDLLTDYLDLSNSQLDFDYKKGIRHNLFDDIHLNTDDRWNMYYSFLSQFFNNLRDVKLFINAFKFNYGIIKGDVNIADFLAISAIQIFENEIYDTIRNNKENLTGTFQDSTDIDTIDNDIQSTIDLYNNIISDIDDLNLAESIGMLLKRMFPKLMIAYGFDEQIYHGFQDLVLIDQHRDKWNQSQRICSPDIFDAYFKLSIPDNKYQFKTNHL